MIKWITKINWGKTLLAGVIYTAVATVVHQIETILPMKYYIDPQYFGVWSKLMMPKASPPPMEFFITSIVMSMVMGVCLAIVYYYIKDMLPKQTMKRVFMFADLLIGLNFLFFTLPVYLMFNVPVVLLVSWFVSGFIILLAASYINVKLLK